MSADALKQLKAKEKEVSQTLENIRDVIFGADRSKWIGRSADETGVFFGVSRRTVMDWCGKGMPHGKGYYPLDKIAKWLRQSKWQLQAPSGEDDLLGGDSSPNLEKYRAARARLAELDLLERERSLLRVDVMRDALSRMSSIIRDAGDILQRQFGTEASKILIEALDDAKTEIDAALTHAGTETERT